MKLSSALMGEYQVKVSVDAHIASQFKSFEIDPSGVAKLAEAMGVPEAIERRLETNANLPRDLAINYVGKNLYFLGGKARGLAHHPRRTFRRRYPPADIQVSPTAILRDLSESDLDSSENTHSLSFDNYVEYAVEETTAHEISHFVDSTFDSLCISGLSKHQAKKIRKHINITQKEIASNHPSVMAKKKKLAELLPNIKLLAKGKIIHATLMDKMFSETGKIIGLEVNPDPLSIGGLTSVIKHWENYYLLPRELMARTDSMIFQEAGLFCCAELRDKPTFSRRTSVLGKWALLTNPASAKATIRR